jgi:hypothetical protein
MSTTNPLLNLPPELLSNIFKHLTTEAFTHLTLTCKQLFRVAENSRDVLFYHLSRLPGIKLGLDAMTVSTPDLALRVRQRASEHLISASLLADCETLGFQPGPLNTAASCLSPASDYLNGCLVMDNSLVIRHCTSNGAMLQQNITSPYGKGSAKILQVIQNTHSISVLYRWVVDKSRVTTPIPDSSSMQSTGISGSYDLSPSAGLASAFQASADADDVRYHLVHYNAYNTDERPAIVSSILKAIVVIKIRDSLGY